MAIFLSPEQLGYQMPNVYQYYPQAPRRVQTEQQQANLAAGRAAMMARRKKDEAARREYAVKAQEEAKKRVSQKENAEYMTRYYQQSPWQYQREYENVGGGPVVRNPDLAKWLHAAAGRDDYSSSSPYNTAIDRMGAVKSGLFGVVPHNAYGYSPLMFSWGGRG